MAIAELDPTTIKARPGSRISDKDAREIAPVLFELEKRDGKLTPEALLEEARSAGHPLHGFFEWDDAVAAEKQRRQTAQLLIRSVCYRVQSLGKNVNDYVGAFVRVRENGAAEQDSGETDVPHVGYASITRVLDNDMLRAQMKAVAVRELENFIRKFETIKALENAMTDARELLEKIRSA